MFDKVIFLVSSGFYTKAYEAYTELMPELDTTSNILNKSLGSEVEMYLYSLCMNGEDDEYSVIKTIIRNLHLLEILLKDPIDITDRYKSCVDDELWNIDADFDYINEDPKFFTPTYIENLKLKRDKLQVVSNAIEDLKSLD